MAKSFSTSQPIYLQLVEEFYRRICRGELKPGDKLPSVRETAAEMGVNPNTVQRAYTDLEREGLIEKRRGQGSFVTEKKQVIIDLRNRLAEEQVRLFYETMKELGFSDEEIIRKVTELSKKKGEGDE